MVHRSPRKIALILAIIALALVLLVFCFCSASFYFLCPTSTDRTSFRLPTSLLQCRRIGQTVIFVVVDGVDTQPEGNTFVFKGLHW